MMQHQTFGGEKHAYTIDQFCAAHGVGRVKTYEEIKAKRLRAVKFGSKTLILAEDAAAWRSSLPALNTAAAA